MNLSIKSILSEKCPYCEKGKVFKKKTDLLKVQEMNTCCEYCGKDFQGEPGYFFGAMYVSYALAVGLSLILFIISWFLLEIRSYQELLAIIWTGIVITAIKNYKLSRVIWLKIFPPGEGTNFTSKNTGQVS